MSVIAKHKLKEIYRLLTMLIATEDPKWRIHTGNQIMRNLNWVEVQLLKDEPVPEDEVDEDDD